MKLFIVILLFATSLFVNAEEYNPSFGLGASINTIQTAVYIPILIGEKNIIAPSISFNSKDNFIIAGVGLEYKRYLTQMYSTKPYFSVGAGYGTSYRNKLAADPNFLVGFASGLEYFVDNNFSLGAEAFLKGNFGSYRTVYNDLEYIETNSVYGFGMSLYITIWI